MKICRRINSLRVAHALLAPARSRACERQETGNLRLHAALRLLSVSAPEFRRESFMRQSFLQELLAYAGP